MIFFELPGWAIALEIVWIVAISCYILLERRPPLATLAWIVSMATLPLLGLFVYYFLGPRRLDRKRRRRIMARNAQRTRAQGTRPDRTTAVDTLGVTGARLAAIAAGTEQAPPLPCASLVLFDLGSDAYDAIIAAIDAAQHHVHLEYYIVTDGIVARRLRDAMIARARAGVEVRLLLDGLGTSRLTGFLKPMRDAGIAVARFGPRMRPGFVNFRTHRKIVVCDGRVGFTGGMNVDDCEDETVSGAEAWRDTHLRMEGDAVVPLALAFLEDWQYATTLMLDGTAYLPALTGTGTQLVQLCASGPDAHPQSIHAVYFAAITTAHTRIWIATPYFVPDESMQSALSGAALRGVDVRVLLPAESDQPLLDAAARSYLPELLAVGVHIHAYGPPALHSKTMLVDSDAAIVGTANLDNRSLRLNFELAAICYGDAPVQALAAIFEADFLHAREVTAESLKSETLPRRLFEGAARLLSPML